jgi:uncharacterized membrane protein
MERIATVFEAVGVAIIAVGGLYGLVLPVVRREKGRSYFEEARRRLAHPLLLGLEVLVAADIILTITVDPSLESVATLGILVLIRVVLSFSLDIEIDGMFPWRRAEHTGGPSAAGPSDD